MYTRDHHSPHTTWLFDIAYLVPGIWIGQKVYLDLRVLPIIAPGIGIMMKYMVLIAMPSWSFKGFFAVDQVVVGSFISLCCLSRCLQWRGLSSKASITN